MSRRVLVTGGAGFIGSTLVRALLDRGDEVVVIDDLSTGRRENLEGLGVELVPASILDETALRRALRGARLAFHLAAQVSVPLSIDDPEANDRVNAGGTRLLYRLAREECVERVVFASSCAVYGDQPGLPKRETSPVRPESPYAASKLAGEEEGRRATALGLPVVSLRFFNVFGPRQRPDGGYAAAIPLFSKALALGRPITIHGDGLQTRDFVPVGHVATALLRAAEVPGAAGGVFNVGSGREMSVLDLVEILAAAAGVEPHERQLVHAPPRPGDIRRSVADVSLARDVLGLEPPDDLDGALRETLAWFRNHGETTR